jgi:hypothetical protein
MILVQTLHGSSEGVSTSESLFAIIVVLLTIAGSGPTIGSTAKSPATLRWKRENHNGRPLANK